MRRAVGLELSLITPIGALGDPVKPGVGLEKKSVKQKLGIL